jgi:TonB-linked SusC/RagA family outer membrane protein
MLYRKLSYAIQRSCLLLVLLVGMQAAAMAQHIKLKGLVQDDQGVPLPDVSVIMQQANGDTKAITTITNEKGVFELSAPKAGNYRFAFTHIGHEQQLIKNFQIKAGEDNTMLVRMKPTLAALNEVMVIGYGTQQKKYVTGAVSKVSGKELNTYSGSSFATQLSGKAAGILVNDASAQPGMDPQIVIRGVGTLTAGRNPLIVVDGFPLSEGTSFNTSAGAGFNATEGGNFNSINPNDIETIDILKDPASAAIYGSRAANGVILITTKKGKNEHMKVTADVYTGIQQRADKVEYVDAYEAALYFTEARDWGYVSKNPANRSITDDRATRVSKGASLRELRLNYLQPYLDKQPGLTNTNWLNETFRTAPMKSYNLSVSGGSARTNYYFSGAYFNQEGLVIENGLKRYSANMKLESKVSDRVDFGINLNPSYASQRYFNNNGNNNTDPIGATNIMYPFFSSYNADGSLAISKQIIANTPEDGALGENTVALAKKITNLRNNFRTFGNTFLSYNLAGFKFKTLLGGDYRSLYYNYYNPSDVGAYRTTAPKPSAAVESNGSSVNYLVEHTLTYSHRFGKHDLNFLAGYTFQKQSGTSTEITGSSIPDDNITNIGGASAFAVTTYKSTWTQISYLSRLQYAYADKYLVSGTIRRDGSSRFGRNSKWGYFPSVTGGWIISKEAFFPKTNALSFAKLRATWGKAGNNQIGPYDSKALVSGGSSYNYVFGNAPASGFGASTTPNERLSWETKTSVNLGADLGLFNRFNLTIDYYRTITSDLLLDVPVPEQSGFNSATQNIGKVKNSGLEAELSGGVTFGKVGWNFSANIATNRNEVLALAPGQKQIISGTESNFYTKVGGPVAELYGYQVTGIYKTQEEIDKTPHLSGTVVGDYVVQDSKTDGVIDANDQVAFGSYFPKLTYGFTNNFSFKNFNLSFAIAGISGRKIYDRQLSTLDDAGEGFAVPSKYYFDNRYHPVDNPGGFLGQPNMGNFSTARKSARTSNIFYKNADYVRLRNVQLSYRLPQALLSKIRSSDATIYVTANNLLTLTEYRGYNPDATTESVLTSGQAIANYPVARSYIIGINIAF